MAKFAAIDIGGTKTEVAIFSDPSQIIPEQAAVFNTDQNYKQGLYNIVHTVKRLLGNEELSATGISFAGVIEDQKIVQANNLPNWVDSPLLDELKQHLICPNVAIANDAVCAGLAQIKDDQTTFISIIWGTGFGAAYIDATKSPAYTLALEPASMVLDKEQVKNQHIKGLARHQVEGWALNMRAGKALSELTDNDPLWESAAQDAGIIINNLNVLFKPKEFIFAGGLIQRRPFLIEMIENQLKWFDFISMPKLRLSNITHNASLTGTLKLLSN